MKDTRRRRIRKAHRKSDKRAERKAEKDKKQHTQHKERQNRRNTHNGENRHKTQTRNTQGKPETKTDKKGDSTQNTQTNNTKKRGRHKVRQTKETEGTTHGQSQVSEGSAYIKPGLARSQIREKDGESRGTTEASCCEGGVPGAEQASQQGQKSHGGNGSSRPELEEPKTNSHQRRTPKAQLNRSALIKEEVPTPPHPAVPGPPGFHTATK